MDKKDIQNIRDPKRSQWMINYFKDDDVFIIGGGYSLYGFDFNRLKNKRVIAVNHAYRYCNPEILVFLDGKFKREVERDFNHDLYKMPFKIVAGPSSGMKPQGNCTVVQIAQRVSDIPWRLYGRAQTGLIAINICLIGKAKNIYLLGFDGGHTHGNKHFYSNDWKHTQDGNEEKYFKMNKRYDAYRGYKNIYNCNEKSKMTQFKKISIDEVLNDQTNM